MKNLREQLMTKAKECVEVPYLWNSEFNEGFDYRSLREYLYSQVNINRNDIIGARRILN